MISDLAKIASLLAKIPSPVRNVIVDVVRAIVSSPNPYAAAQRALEESSRVEAFDAAMKRIKP